MEAGLHPDPLGELTALPRPLAVSNEGRDGRWELKRGGKERNHSEKREIKGKGGILGIMECVPYCGSALLATI